MLERVSRMMPCWKGYLHDKSKEGVQNHVQSMLLWIIFTMGGGGNMASITTLYRVLF